MSKKKDFFYAKTAFYLSLGFWIPLFNVAMSILSIYFAFKALKLIDKHPEKYSGRKYTIIALVLSLSSLLLMIVGGVGYLVLRRGLLT